MPTPIYMHIPGIAGESVAVGHEGWIEVLAFSFGAFRPDDTSSGRARAATEFQPVSVTKWIDSATTDLLLATANGRALPSLQISVLRGGGAADGQRLPYFDVELRNVRVTSFSSGGSVGEDRLTENVTFAYQEIEWTYHQVSRNGSTESESASWDLGAGKKA